MKNNRRIFIKKSSSMAAAISIAGLGGYRALAEAANEKSTNKPEKIEWPIADNPNTPRICVGVSMDADEKAMQKIKQVGIDYVLMGGPQIPWTEEGLRTIMNRFKKNGLTVINMMIGGHPNAIYGREG